MWFLACSTAETSPPSAMARVEARVLVQEDEWSGESRQVVDAVLAGEQLAVELRSKNSSYSYSTLALLPLPLQGDTDPSAYVIEATTFHSTVLAGSGNLLVVGDDDAAIDAGRISFWKAPLGNRPPDAIWEGQNAGSCGSGCEYHIGGDAAGAALSIVDLEGDGVEEILVGAPGWDHDPGARDSWDSSFEGAVFVIRDPDALGGTLGDAQRLLSGRLHGENGSSSFGMGLEAGDLDGDGYPELLVSDLEHPSGPRIFVFPGGLQGPAEEGDAVAILLGIAGHTIEMEVGELEGEGVVAASLPPPGSELEPGQGGVGLWRGRLSGSQQAQERWEGSRDGLWFGEDLLLWDGLWVVGREHSDQYDDPGLPPARRGGIYGGRGEGLERRPIWESWSGWTPELLGGGELSASPGEELLIQDGYSLLVLSDLNL